MGTTIETKSACRISCYTEHTFKFHQNIILCPPPSKVKIQHWNWVSLSVCLSVCLSRSRALQKRLNRLRCRLGFGLGWAQESTCARSRCTLANTIEPSMCGGDAALRQIALTTNCCYYRRPPYTANTCVSLRPSAEAISMRRARVRYLLKWNSFSSSVSCLLVKLVRPRLD